MTDKSLDMFARLREPRDQPRIVWATEEQRHVDRQVAGRIMVGARVLLTFTADNAQAALDAARRMLRRAK